MFGIHDNQAPVNAVRESLEGGVTTFPLQSHVSQIRQVFQPDNPQMGRPVYGMDGRFEGLLWSQVVIASLECMVGELYQETGEEIGGEAS